MNATQHPALAYFSRLLDMPSVSGREQGVAALVREHLDEWGVAHETDAAGNVLVRLAGRQPDLPLICYAAHMDEIGMTVTAVHDDGTLAVQRSGGLYPWKLGEGPVEIVGDHDSLTGVLSMGSTHTADAGAQSVTWNQVRIITGLSREQLAAAGVRPGSVATPVRAVRGPVLFGDDADPLVAAWTFDDRMGVVALLRLLEILQRERRQPAAPTLVAFTVGEEVGGLGAKVVARHAAPEIFVAVDGCPIPPGLPLVLDSRPGIWTRDRLAPYDVALVEVLMNSALEAGTSLQPVAYDSAASDASLVQAAGLAPRIACFGHVRENSHGYEVARLSVFDNVLATLLRFVIDYVPA